MTVLEGVKPFVKGEGTFRFGFALFFYWVEVSAVHLHYAEAAKSRGGHTTDAPGVVDVVLVTDIVLNNFLLLLGGEPSQEPVLTRTFIWHLFFIIYHLLST